MRLGVAPGFAFCGGVRNLPSSVNTRYLVSRKGSAFSSLTQPAVCPLTPTETPNNRVIKSNLLDQRPNEPLESGREPTSNTHKVEFIYAEPYHSFQRGRCDQRHARRTLQIGAT